MDKEKHSFHFGSDRHIHIKNLSAFWIPELAIKEELARTIYTVTGSYEGTESFLHTLEHVAAKNFSEELEVG